MLFALLFCLSSTLQLHNFHIYEVIRANPSVTSHLLSSHFDLRKLGCLKRNLESLVLFEKSHPVLVCPCRILNNEGTIYNAFGFHPPYCQPCDAKIFLQRYAENSNLTLRFMLPLDQASLYDLFDNEKSNEFNFD